MKRVNKCNRMIAGKTVQAFVTVVFVVIVKAYRNTAIKTKYSIDKLFRKPSLLQVDKINV